MSRSADAPLQGAPESFTLPVRDLRADAGVGWLVAIYGVITQMPGRLVSSEAMGALGARLRAP
jgi:formyltetrahydrofolate synthetase